VYSFNNNVLPLLVGPESARLQSGTVERPSMAWSRRRPLRAHPGGNHII